MKRAAFSLLLALAPSLVAQDDLTVLKPLTDGTTPAAAFRKMAAHGILQTHRRAFR